MYVFIYRPPDSDVSEDDGIEPGTVATMALTARRSNHSETTSIKHKNHLNCRINILFTLPRKKQTK